LKWFPRKSRGAPTRLSATSYKLCKELAPLPRAVLHACDVVAALKAQAAEALARAEGLTRVR